MILSRHIFVEGLCLEAHIGVRDKEKGLSQPIEIDAVIEIGTDSVAHLSQTYNYETIEQIARKLLSDGHIDLVENLAESLGTEALKDPMVRSIEITVRKPKALDCAHAAGCTVLMVRGD
jgi:dihydroneopterin aldolase